MRLQQAWTSQHILLIYICVIAVCQTLRIISFTVTQLPAPNYHCRKGEVTAVREMPEQWWGHVAVDLKRRCFLQALILLTWHSAEESPNRDE